MAEALTPSVQTSTVALADLLAYLNGNGQPELAGAVAAASNTGTTAAGLPPQGGSGYPVPQDGSFDVPDEGWALGGLAVVAALILLWNLK